MTDDAMPRTEAGRVLLMSLRANFTTRGDGVLPAERDAILAIEREAALSAPAGLDDRRAEAYGALIRVEQAIQEARAALDGLAWAALAPASPEAGVSAGLDMLRAALVYAYQEGHSEGIGCGHDLAPPCRHDAAEWVAGEEGLAYVGSPVRDALAHPSGGTKVNDLARAIQTRTLLDLPEQPTEADRQATYIAALAYGLSDAEAREEAWPSPALGTRGLSHDR